MNEKERKIYTDFHLKTGSLQREMTTPSAVRGDRMTPEEQLTKWVDGDPVHTDECVPDFSCCRGVGKMVEKSTREAFARAGEDTRMEMLTMFLGAALADTPMRDVIYISGLDTPDGVTE